MIKLLLRYRDLTDGSKLYAIQHLPEVPGSVLGFTIYRSRAGQIHEECGCDFDQHLIPAIFIRDQFLICPGDYLISSTPKSQPTKRLSKGAFEARYVQDEPQKKSAAIAGLSTAINPISGELLIVYFDADNNIYRSTPKGFIKVKGEDNDV